MKVDLPFIPSTLLPQEKKVVANAPSTSGAAGTVIDSSNVERDSNAANEKAFKYPLASPEEIAAKNRRADAAVANNLGAGEPGPNTAGALGAKGFKFKPKPKPKPRPPKPSTPPKPKPKPKPTPTPTPPKPPLTGAPNNPSATLNTAQSIVSRSQNLPPAPPTVAATVRDAFITAGVENMVSSPFTVGQQLTSSYFQSKSEAHNEMPGAEVQNADGTVGTVNPAATKEQKMEARLTGAEIKNEITSNLFIFLNLGAEANAVQPSDKAPTDTEGRLSNVEASLDAIETQMPELAGRFKVMYEPYEAAASSEAPTEESRMENIEKRQSHINETVELLKTIQSQKAQKKP